MPTFFSARGVRVRALPSFRLTAAGVATDRLVLAVPIRAVTPLPSRLLEDVLAELAAPHPVAGAVRSLAPRAHQLHVGHEVHVDEVRWKVYLEHHCGFDDEPPGTVFVAWKWTMSAPAVRSNYRWLPFEPGEGPGSALEGSVGVGSPVGRALMRLVVSLPDASAPGSTFDRLVMNEASAERMSVDVDVSPARASVGDLRVGLRSVASALGLASLVADELVATIGGHQVSRLASGTGPEGPFVTVYHEPALAGRR